MKHYLIYTNQYKDLDGEMTNRIKDYLISKGQKTTLVAGDDGVLFSEKDIPEDACCMIVLGGDGTMLRAARDTKKRNIPLLGINLGTLGYMTEVEPGMVEESLDKLISGQFQTESRMMLKGYVSRKDAEIIEDCALNDVVISRSGSLHIIKLNVYVNGQFLTEYDADGVIITTPTGSTGYNLSAGGPIVEPKAQLIMLTPICPHTLNARSIILSAEDEVEIEIPMGRDDKVQEVEANFDGANAITMYTGESIRIVKSEKTTEIIQINRVSFLEVLHKKFSDK